MELRVLPEKAPERQNKPMALWLKYPWPEQLTGQLHVHQTRKPPYPYSR